MIKETILQKYPNIKINNEHFLNNKALKEKEGALTLDEIARLSELSETDGQIASKYILYYDSHYSTFNQMVKYIAIHNPSFLKKIDTFTYKERETEVYQEYERLYKTNTFTEETFQNILVQNESNINLPIRKTTISIFNEIIIASKLYSERKLSREDIIKFKIFYTKYIENKALEEYSSKSSYRIIPYDKIIVNIVDSLLEGKITISDFLSTMQGRTGSLLKLLTKAKTGITVSKELPLDIIDSIKGGTIKNIIKEIDNLNINITDEEKVIISIKLIAYFKADNALQIIRNFPKEKNEIERITNIFLNLALSNIEVINGKIKYNEEFINFFVGSNIKEPNSLFNKIKENKTNLDKHIDGIYAFWDELNKRYYSQHLQTRMAFLENAFKEGEVFLNPDEFELEGEIINTYIDNTAFQSLEKKQMIEEVRKVYHSMKHKFKKTIPYVKGNYEDIEYETLKAGDPKLLELGNITACCFKVGGDSDNFVRYCAEDLNARVMCFKKNGHIIGMTPIIRNGNIIICNSIETNHFFNDKLLLALKKASEEILEISNQKESEESKIKTVLITSHKEEDKISKIYPKTKTKIDTLPIDKTIYVNMGPKYDTYIVAKNFESEDELKEYIPNYIYVDSREPIKDADEDSVDESIKKHINSIYYEKHKSTISKDAFNKIKYLSYNQDWFVMLTKDGLILSECIDDDPRARYEYEEVLEAFEEYKRVNIK